MAVHVDDLICTGTDLFAKNITDKLRALYPFKHSGRLHHRAEGVRREVEHHQDFKRERERDRETSRERHAPEREGKESAARSSRRLELVVDSDKT